MWVGQVREGDETWLLCQYIGGVERLVGVEMGGEFSVEEEGEVVDRET